MSLDPQAQKVLTILAEVRKNPPPIAQLTAKLIREWSAELKPKLQTARDSVGEVKDLQVPGKRGNVSVRVYTAVKGTPAPMALYMHGGGFAAGSIDLRDNTCKSICQLSGFSIASIEYGLAPENKYPGGLDDCQSVAEWALKDFAKIALIGDSAGAALAAVVAHRLGNKISGQVLINPWTDLTNSLPSVDEFAGVVLSRASLDWFAQQYIPAGLDLKDPSVSPMFIGNLSNVANTFVLTAECDPVRDDGEEFARRLKDAGVRVIQRRYPGMIHGFIDANLIIDLGREAIQDICTFLKRLPPL